MKLPRVRWEVFAMSLAGLVVIASFAVTGWALHNRSSRIDDLLFEQCVANEQQDTVIVQQLRAAARRARASLPAGSPVLLDQLQTINDGITTLEPEDEKDCAR